MVLSTYPELLAFPEQLMRDRMCKWELAGRTVSGGRTVGGALPIGRIDGGGIWNATLTDVQVSQTAHVMSWRALASLLDGGATPVVLTVREPLFFPAPVVGGQRLLTLTTTNDDDVSTDDDAGYLSAVVEAKTSAAAALRATTLNIVITAGSALQGGEHFSIEHDTFSHHLYRVASVTEFDGFTQVTIRPPLREAVAANTRLEFDYPKCVMQLAAADEMDLSLEMRMYGQASVRFIESFPPWS